MSASHRLYCAEWDEARNLEAFGKCANPYGHGHNYVVEVLTGGAVDPVTGMVVDLVELDACVAREMLEPFDHANLNLHAAFERKGADKREFLYRDLRSTGEGALPSGLAAPGARGGDLEQLVYLHRQNSPSPAEL